ncbi:hypothetical protein N752_10355 [Desulforamulus aquiferis]|nr:hypothetical protein N752_10355 [Desulforamulus aquiferis]
MADAELLALDSASAAARHFTMVHEPYHLKHHL